MNKLELIKLILSGDKTESTPESSDESFLVKDFHEGSYYHSYKPGLTKREYFAALAMQGLCADPGVTIAETVDVAIKVADALIEQLNKPKE
jgi:hypothetical protein